MDINTMIAALKEANKNLAEVQNHFYLVKNHPHCEEMQKQFDTVIAEVEELIDREEQPEYITTVELKAHTNTVEYTMRLNGWIESEYEYCETTIEELEETISEIRLNLTMGYCDKLDSDPSYMDLVECDDWIEAELNKLN